MAIDYLNFQESCLPTGYQLSFTFSENSLSRRCKEEGSSSSLLRVGFCGDNLFSRGNGRAKINSSFPSWRQEDIRNVKGNSSLSLTKYRRRGVDRSSCAEHNPFVRSFTAESARDHLTDISRGATTSSSKGVFKICKGISIFQLCLSNLPYLT